MEGQEEKEGGGEEETGVGDTGSRKRRREQQKEVSSCFSTNCLTAGCVQNATFAVCVSDVSVVRGPVREEVQRRCQDILNWEG